MTQVTKVLDVNLHLCLFSEHYAKTSCHETVRRFTASYQSLPAEDMAAKLGHPTPYELGHLDRRSNLSTYSIVVLGFSVAQSHKCYARKHVERAASQLEDGLPWISGRVAHSVEEAERATSSGTYYIELSDRKPILTWQDRSQELGGYSSGLSQGAPMQMLPAHFLTAQRGLPEHVDPSQEQALPFTIHANGVSNGIYFASRRTTT